MNRILSIISVLVCCAASAACMSSDQLRRRQYDADYQQALQSCGRPDAAYQGGYNDGYAGRRMYGEWTALCAPGMQAEAFAAYQSGFLKGANNAPIQVVHTVRPIHTLTPNRPFATTAVAQCTFDSDCGGDGYHCRDHACMGFGDIGDRCVFNEDCANDHCFGGTCHE